MGSWYGTGMFHLVLHRDAFIKAKWTSELGLSGRGSEADTPGYSCLGESSHKKCI